MECPQCGYVLTPFEKDCPRCVHFAKTQASNSRPDDMRQTVFQTSSVLDPVFTPSQQALLVLAVHTYCAYSLRERLDPVYAAIAFEYFVKQYQRTVGDFPTDINIEQMQQTVKQHELNLPILHAIVALSETVPRNQTASYVSQLIHGRQRMPFEIRPIPGYSICLTGLGCLGIGLLAWIGVGGIEGFGLAFLIGIIGVFIFLYGLRIDDSAQPPYKAMEKQNWPSGPYDTYVSGHWRRSRNGSYHWVSSHGRSVGARRRW